MDALALIAGLREDLAAVDEQIRTNSWLADLEAGTLPRAALRDFAAEQFQIIPSDLRSFLQMADRCATEPAHGYLGAMAEGEQAALKALEALAAAVGLTEHALHSYQPVPGCQAYPSYLARLARDGTSAEMAGAFLVNLQAWGHCCARMAQALPRHYGLDDSAVAFFTLFAAPTAELERTSLAVVDAGLTDGAEPAGIARAARLLQAYELLFWNSLPR